MLQRQEAPGLCPLFPQDHQSDDLITAGKRLSGLWIYTSFDNHGICRLPLAGSSYSSTAAASILQTLTSDWRL